MNWMEEDLTAETNEDA